MAEAQKAQSGKEAAAASDGKLSYIYETMNLSVPGQEVDISGFKNPQALAESKAKREAAFLQSVEAEKTRGDALSKRFEEALRQARDEPVGPPPKRDFDLD